MAATGVAGILAGAVPGALTSDIGVGAFVPQQRSGDGAITVAPGAVVVQVGDNVDPAAARAAFSDAGEELAALLTALRRR